MDSYFDSPDTFEPSQPSRSARVRLRRLSIVSMIVILVIGAGTAVLIWPPDWLQQISLYHQIFPDRSFAPTVVTAMTADNYAHQAASLLSLTPTTSEQGSDSATLYPQPRPQTVIFDIRPTVDFLKKHIATAQSIPLSTLTSEQIGPAWTVIIYGSTQAQVDQAASILKQKHVAHIYAISDDFSALEKAGVRTVTGQEQYAL